MTWTSARRRFLRSNWTPGGINLCFYCQQPMTRRDRTIDHITPRAKGGGNQPSNLALACQRCNTSKSDMDLAEFVDFVATHGGIEEVKRVYGRSSGHTHARP